MKTVGIDIGSNTTKAALMEDGKLIATRIISTGYNAKKAGEKVFEEILSAAGLSESQIDGIIATGYGRNSVERAHRKITEITCHAAGVHYTDPEICSIIDIGGQDSKSIVIDEKGAVKDFAMNDKCAAGTGRFLEVMARALEVDLDAFGDISLTAQNPARISSLCTVFAESEVITLISKGEVRENIIAGIHESVAARVAAMANRIGVRAPLMMTGGVANNIGVVRALEDKLGLDIRVSETAQVNGAIGAAFLGQNK